LTEKKRREGEGEGGTRRRRRRKKGMKTERKRVLWIGNGRWNE
jgi:hypothetical protein